MSRLGTQGDIDKRLQYNILHSKFFLANIFHHKYLFFIAALNNQANKNIFKFYFIDYAITVVLTFPTLPHNPHTTVHVHGSCIWVLWLLHCLYCTCHPHGDSVTTYLYFLIPSPLHPFPYSPLPSDNHQNTLHIHDSVCSSSLISLVFRFNCW